MTAYGVDKEFSRIFRPTFGLWGIALILGFVIAYLELKPKPEAYDDGGLVFYTQLEANTEPLPLVDTDIRTLIIERKDETLEFQKAGTQWDLVKPFGWYAHPSTVNEVLRRLCENRYEERYTKTMGYDLKTMGLESPRLKLTMVDNQGKRHELHVGDKVNEQSDKVFVYRPDSERVYVVDDAVARSEYTPMDRILRRESVQVNQSDLEMMRLSAYNRQYELKRDAAVSRWKLGWSADQWADDKQVDRFVKSFMPNYAAIYDRHPANLEQYGLDRPAFRVTFVEKGGVVNELQVGAPPLGGGEFLYAKNSRFDTVFQLQADFLDNFKIDTASLRDDLYIQKPKAYRGTAEIEITNNEPDIDQYLVIKYLPQARGLQIVEMGQLSQRMMRPGGMDLEGNNIVHPESQSKFENDFFDLRAVDYYPASEFNLKKYGFQDIYTRVKANLVDENLNSLKKVDLKLTRGDYGEVYAWQEGNPYIIRVNPANKLYWVVRSPDNFRVTFLWLIPRDHEIYSIEIERPEDSTVLSRRFPNWLVNGINLGLIPLGQAMGGPTKILENVCNYIRQLIPFQTVRRAGEVTAEDLKTFGLDPPLLKVRVGHGPQTIQNADELVIETLWLGDQDPADGDWYATADEGKSIVKVDVDLATTFMWELNKPSKGVAEDAKKQSDENEGKIKAYLNQLVGSFAKLKSEKALPDSDGNGEREYCDLFTLSNLMGPDFKIDKENKSKDGVYYRDGYFIYIYLPSDITGNVSDNAKHFAIIAWPEMIGFSGTKVFVTLDDGKLYSNPNANPRKLYNRRSDFGNDINVNLLFPGGEFDPVKLNPIFQRDK